MHEESSGSDYTPTDSEERITDESSDADDSDADEFDADDIEVLSGEENLPSEVTVKLMKRRLLGSQFVNLYVCFPLLEKKNYVYNLTMVLKMESPCQ